MKPAALVPLLVMSVAAPAVADPAACRAESASSAPTLVELYTSEGCSSCPPADRWLSTLKGRRDVVALAFHVDYWDKLGWTDRFATAGNTARQAEQARVDGGGVYTPQVVVDGRDWRGWPRLPAAASAPARVALALQRDGEQVQAEVAPLRGGPARLAGWWAVVEDDYLSRVRAGENAGETLHHDHVVRLYRPVAAWPAGDGLRTALPVSRGVPEHPRQVVFVVTDAATGRPLQSLALGC